MRGSVVGTCAADSVLGRTPTAGSSAMPGVASRSVSAVTDARIGASVLVCKRTNRATMRSAFVSRPSLFRGLAGSRGAFEARQEAVRAFRVASKCTSVRTRIDPPRRSGSTAHFAREAGGTEGDGSSRNHERSGVGYSPPGASARVRGGQLARAAARLVLSEESRCCESRGWAEILVDPMQIARSA